MQLKIRGAVLEEIGRKRPFAESTPISISELDLESPGPGEILVKIEAAGLCHSDLSVVDGNRVRPVPMLLGYEAAGRIIELGDGVDSLSVGTRVVMTFLPRCGECAGCATDGRMPCTVGSAANNDGSLLGGAHRLRRSGENVKHHLGVSGFATHAVVNAKSVVPVDDDIPAEIAAVLGCAVLTGGGALLNAAKPRPADTVMVVGLGGVGMAAILTARALGVENVIGVDALESKLAQALELGATEVFTPSGLSESGVRADIVVEAAGNARAFETAVAATAAGARPSRSGCRRLTRARRSHLSDWSPKRGPLSAATWDLRSRPATSRSTRSCGATGSCRSRSSFPRESNWPTSIRVWTNSPTEKQSDRSLSSTRSRCTSVLCSGNEAFALPIPSRVATENRYPL